MGYAVSSSLDPDPRVARLRQTALLIFGALALCLVSLGSITTAGAQSPAGETSQPVKAPDKLVIDADELVYDKDKNTVSAVGSVQLFYQGRILQADRVTYNRATKRVYAEGHAKMTDEHGDVVYGSRFELSDNFREGFIDSVQVLTSDKTRFTSPRVERSNGDVTVLRKGAYTACEPCKDHPEWPPFWQVRAARIIENQETHTVYFEDAQMLVWGVPVFYMPYFSSPDATVNKQTGLLAPQFVSGSSLGYGLSLPYFINLAPNYDLTLIPTYLSKQGLLGEVDWRQRLSNGTYSIRMTGIDQQQPNLFASYPYGAGDERVRGSVETKGNFFLNQNWQFGWNATWLSDKFFANDYKLQGFDFSNFYFQDVVSSIYLRGQADHSFFDLSVYHFEGTTPNDDNRTLPVAAPVFDYNRVFAVPADRTYGVGGEATVDINVANIDRTNAAFQSTGLQTFDNAYHLYNVCETVVDGKYVNTYYPGACMLRGIAGDYTRASGQVSWQRSYIDTIGEVWKPFAFARLDGEATELNETGSITYASSIGSSTVANSSQAAFFSGSNQGAFARGMAGVGLEYRYPFTSTSSWGTQTITPIGQLIVRPSEIIPAIQPNEDAQSLVFDETNLFAWNKFSGYDRIEGGTRFNYGFQYTADFGNGGHANVVAGQSIQVAGQNSYTLYDIANTGLDSGLNKTMSNFVAGETLQPTSAPVSFISKQQFDSSTLQLERFDAIAKATIAGVDRQRRLCALRGPACARLGISARGPDGERVLQIPRSLVGRRISRPRHVAALLRHRRAGNPDLVPGRLFVWAGLQGRLHHPHGPVLVEPQRAGGVSGIRRRTGDLQPGRPQPDADVPAGPAHARRRQGECRPLTS